MNTIDSDMIAAQATPYGKSAIAVIRISGKGCIKTVERRLDKKLESNIIRLYKFKAVDFVENLMATCYKAPKSYTGEDEVELYCHGNPVICDGIIKALFELKIRLAMRGEFTKRAMLNGKINLMQCEALADIIDAQTTEQLIYGNNRYANGITNLDSVKQILQTALSSIEAAIHYSDELEENEVDSALLNDVYKGLNKAIVILRDEKTRYGGGRIINEGFKIAIIGEPNVGKSTLLNALTEKDRAIVTDIAGTTRDTIEDGYVYKHKKFNVIDTAGITETTDTVEKIGVERAKRAAETADAVLYVTCDSTKAEKYLPKSGTIRITVLNKCDSESDVIENYKKAEKDGVLRISAKNGVNITALKEKIYSVCPKDSGAICNHRQYDCVLRCLDSCLAAESESAKVNGLEIVAALLYDAYSAITELYGETADEKILETVFQRFCVGK